MNRFFLLFLLLALSCGEPRAAMMVHVFPHPSIAQLEQLQIIVFGAEEDGDERFVPTEGIDWRNGEAIQFVFEQEDSESVDFSVQGLFRGAPATPIANYSFTYAEGQLRHVTVALGAGCGECGDGTNCGAVDGLPVCTDSGELRSGESQPPTMNPWGTAPPPPPPLCVPDMAGNCRALPLNVRGTCQDENTCQPTSIDAFGCVFRSWADGEEIYADGSACSCSDTGDDCCDELGCCEAGTCVSDACATVSCRDEQVCIDGECVDEDPCGGFCESDDTACNPATGLCELTCGEDACLGFRMSDGTCSTDESSGCAGPDSVCRGGSCWNVDVASEPNIGAVAFDPRGRLAIANTRTSTIRIGETLGSLVPFGPFDAPCAEAGSPMVAGFGETIDFEAGRLLVGVNRIDGGSSGVLELVEQGALEGFRSSASCLPGTSDAAWSVSLWTLAGSTFRAVGSIDNATGVSSSFPISATTRWDSPSLMRAGHLSSTRIYSFATTKLREGAPSILEVGRCIPPSGDTGGFMCMPIIDGYAGTNGWIASTGGDFLTAVPPAGAGTRGFVRQVRVDPDSIATEPSLHRFDPPEPWSTIERDNAQHTLDVSGAFGAVVLSHRDGGYAVFVFRRNPGPEEWRRATPFYTSPPRIAVHHTASELRLAVAQGDELTLVSL